MADCEANVAFSDHRRFVGAALFVSACGGDSDGVADIAEPDPTSKPATSTEPPPPSSTASDSSTVAWPHDWTEELVGGGQFDAGDYEGQDLVLWFWAPW